MKRILRGIGMRREAPTDLRAVLRDVEEKVFRNRVTQTDTETQDFQSALDKLMRDPATEARVRREQERAEEKKRDFRSYKITEGFEIDEQKKDLYDRVELVKQKIADQEAKFFEVSNVHEFQKRALRYFDAHRWGSLA